MNHDYHVQLNRGRKSAFPMLIVALIASLLSWYPAPRAALAAQHNPGNQTTVSPAVIIIDSGPPAVLRRAVEFLEGMRSSPIATNWAKARLNIRVTPFYRPDIKEPAYYEYKVETFDVQGAPVPAGFILLSAGDHDYPIAHWDSTGSSPSQQLLAEIPDGAYATRFYKLDALSYVAEYEYPILLGQSTVAAADQIVNIGDIPGRFVGLDKIPNQAADPMADDADTDGNKSHSGPTNPPAISQEDWASWSDLKAGYAGNYQPFLQSLQQRTSAAWNLEDSLTRYGETLVKGDVRTIYGLPDRTVSGFSVTGAGASSTYLQQDQLNSGTALRITVLEQPQDRKTLLDVNVQVQYSNGFSETLKYAIANNMALTSSYVYLPMVGASSVSPQSVVPSTQATTPELTSTANKRSFQDWGPWQYWWADGDAGSINYGQYDYAGCKSGCGGTAWAMLFAWVDRRAAESHPVWRNHWGLYRQNGGLGANVTAPTFQDTGVQNMTTEIRNLIGTFCIFGSGATWPWRMFDAINYVRPRATAAASMQTKYDPTGLCWFGACNGNRDLAKSQIINRRAPAIVGVGWLKHYPLAFGYAERSKRSCFLFFCDTSYSRWFYVNNGWYGRDNGWVNADVWFAGVYNAR